MLPDAGQSGLGARADKTVAARPSAQLVFHHLSLSVSLLCLGLCFVFMFVCEPCDVDEKEKEGARERECSAKLGLRNRNRNRTIIVNENKTHIRVFESHEYSCFLHVAKTVNISKRKPE